MDPLRVTWQGRLLSQLQGPSSLGMALSGSAVGFSASIIDPKVYVGFWTSLAFQMHAGFQLLAIAFGVLFAVLRLRNYQPGKKVSAAENTLLQPVSANGLGSNRAGRFAVTAIYAQLFMFFAGAVSFVWLMFLYFRGALYPSG